MKRLNLVDVNDYHTWVDNPEKVEIDIVNAPWAVPNFNWPLDSHPGMWTQGKHIVRWWIEDDPMSKRI